MSHTKGPWSVEPHWSGSTSVAQIRSPKRLVSVDCAEGLEPWYDTDANARLIAAAPDLAEAAREALAFIVRDNRDELKLDSHLSRIVERLRSALQKAGVL